MVGLYVMQRVHVMYMVVLGAVGGSYLWNYVLQCVGVEVQWSGAREREQRVFCCLRLREHVARASAFALSPFSVTCARDSPIDDVSLTCAIDSAWTVSLTV